jgi:hypothetical protein
MPYSANARAMTSGPARIAVSLALTCGQIAARSCPAAPGVTLRGGLLPQLAGGAASTAVWMAGEAVVEPDLAGWLVWPWLAALVFVAPVFVALVHPDIAKTTKRAKMTGLVTNVLLP